MALSINTNIGALGAAAAASAVNKSMETSMERLSTGLRINSSADDAAGMAITSRMEAAVRGMNQAIRNAMDTQALIDTAEGAQSETMNLLQRMRELAIQAATDTNSQSDRTALNSEIIQLRAEIDRIADTTTWAGQKVLDGSFVGKTFQIGAFEGETINVSQKSVKTADFGQHYKDTVAFFSAEGASAASAALNTIAADTLTVVGKSGSSTVSTSADGSAKDLAALVNAKTSSTGVYAKAQTALKLSGLSANPVGSTTSFTLQAGSGTAVSISATVTDNADLSTLVSVINTNSGTTGITAEFDGTDKSAIILRDADGDNIQITDFSSTGAASAALTIAVSYATTYDATAFSSAGTLTSAAATDSIDVGGVARFYSTESFTVSGDSGDADGTDDATGFFASAGVASSLSKVSTVSVATRAGAAAAIDVLDSAIQFISDARSSLGAISNRLDSTVSNLTNIVGNTESSRARIEDADFAAESTNLAKAQILQQAATAMLAQANASKQGVLQLLQG